MIELQGGSLKVVDDYSIFQKAQNIYYLKSAEKGYLKFIKTRDIGIASCLLGAGRLKVEDKIDFSSGIIIHKKNGDFINRGDVIFELKYNKSDISAIIELLKNTYIISEEKVEKTKKIKDIIK